MIWILLALLAGAAVVKSSAKPSDSPDEQGPGGTSGPLQLVTVGPPSVDGNASLADQLVARTADFTRVLDAVAVNLPIAIGAQSAGDRAKINESLGLAGKQWSDLSSYQVSFVTSLVGAYTGQGAGSNERLLILLSNASTTKVALDAIKTVMQTRPGFNEADWGILSSLLKGAVDAGVPPYIGVAGQSVRGYLYGKESSGTVSPTATVADYLKATFPELSAIDSDSAIKAVTGVIPVDSLSISEENKKIVKDKIASLSGDLKEQAVGYVLSKFNPDEYLRKYVPVVPIDVTIPGTDYKIPVRRALRVILGETLSLPTITYKGIPVDLNVVVRAAYPTIDADIAKLQAAIPQDVKNLVNLYLNVVGAIESAGGSVYECVPRGFCKLVAGFDGLPADQRNYAFTAFGRMKTHFASHAPVVAALGLLAFCSENWTLYSPLLSEMTSGSFETALAKGLTSSVESADSAKARAARYRQFYTALVIAIATTTANDLGVPIYGWKRVLEKTWAGWDGGITGARDAGSVYPGASGVAFAYYFAEQASLEIKKQLAV